MNKQQLELYREDISDHHEEYYDDCPRCIEIKARNHLIDQLLEKEQNQHDNKILCNWVYGKAWL